MSFDGWLDARDGETVMREWETLGAVKVPMKREPPPRPEIAKMMYGYRPDNAAALAATFLGIPYQRLAWFKAEPWESERLPPPTYHTGGEVPRLVFEGMVLCEHECGASIDIREIVEGTRGVQHIKIDWYWGEFTREGGNGGSQTFVRVFDRSTRSAVSIRLYEDHVWTIGDPSTAAQAIDLAPLDLFGDRVEFKLAWKPYELDAVRGLIARLIADFDAHFDTAPSWPGGVIHEQINDISETMKYRQRDYRYASGAYAIAYSEFLEVGTPEPGAARFQVEGLPPGCALDGYLEGTDDPVFGVKGWLSPRLPRAQLEATLARLAAMPAEITY